MPRPSGTPKETIYCPRCRTVMEFDRTESRYQITWNIYKCPKCGFESNRRKY